MIENDVKRIIFFPPGFFVEIEDESPKKILNT